MNNNDMIIRLRYALELSDKTMLEIFDLGEYSITSEQLRHVLTKQDPELELPRDAACSDRMLESFLNGLIILKRGKQEVKPGTKVPNLFLISSAATVNNVLLKKVKIALSLTSEDILDVLHLAGVYASPSELSAILRKEGQRNYKPCGDRYARNFLRGLTIHYRENQN